jgi:Fe-S oxidoreductase
MAVFQKYRFARTVTSCPHAHNAFQNHYPALGFNWGIEHATPFLAKHLDRLRPLLTRKLGYQVTYHDSCCLGRQSDLRLRSELPGRMPRGSRAGSRAPGPGNRDQG